MIKKRVKVWTNACVEELKGCFECTDWDVFLDASERIDEVTDAVHAYISFCLDLIVPQKTIKIFPNNKPWMTKSVKSVLNEKKIAFQSGNTVTYKTVQKKLQKEIPESKRL